MHGCPDIDVLIELSRGRAAQELAVLDHTAACDQCRKDLAILGGVRTALDPQREVPEALVASVMAALPEPPPEPEPAVSRPGRSPFDRLVPFGLATATVGMALLVASPAESLGAITDLAIFSALVGIVASFVEPRVHA